MGGDPISEFADITVSYNFKTKKWTFQNKEFKRKGQAEKAARLFYHLMINLEE